MSTPVVSAPPATAPVIPLFPTPTPAQPVSLLINREARTVQVEAHVVDVTRLEFDLLAFYASHPGRAFTRTALLAAVWDDTFGIGTGRTVDVHTFRLRRKLGPEGRHLVTVRGVGYRWDGPAA